MLHQTGTERQGAGLGQLTGNSSLNFFCQQNTCVSGDIVVRETKYIYFKNCLQYIVVVLC